MKNLLQVEQSYYFFFTEGYYYNAENLEYNKKN